MKRASGGLPLACYCMGIIITSVLLAVLATLAGINWEAELDVESFPGAFVVLPIVLVLVLLSVVVGEVLYCASSVLLRGMHLNQAIDVHFRQRSFRDWCTPLDVE